MSVPVLLGAAAAPRESESHDRRLHAGSRSAEARGTEQFGQIGKAGRRSGNQARLSGSNWILEGKRWLCGTRLFCWRPYQRPFWTPNGNNLGSHTPVWTLRKRSGVASVQYLALLV